MGIQRLKLMFRRIIYGNKASGKLYLEHLRKKGAKIGEDVTVYSPIHTTIDEQYPWMIEIGNHVRITQGVILLTHDYSWSVLKRIKWNGKAGFILGNAGKITIGDNVFLGMNTVVLGGVSIGDNVVVGAGSVVTKSCESNSVYAGVPAKKVMSIEEYFAKRQRKQLEEAKKLAIEYKKRFKQMPPKNIFHEYFMLFSTEEDMESDFWTKMKLCGNYDESYELLKKRHNEFETYEEFMEYCFRENELTEVKDF